MKIVAKNYGPLLIPVILTKIPDDIKLIISRKFGKNIWNAEPILEELESELFAREKLSAMKQTTSSEIDTEFEKEFSAQSLLNSDSNIVLCVFCKKGNHKPRNCRNVAIISERTNILQRAGRCFLCLRKGHVVKNCPAKFSCFNCKRRHHVSICLHKKNENHENKHSIENRENQTNEFHTNVAPASNNEGDFSMSCDENNILLQTARAHVLSTDGNKNANLRILFDSGSQLSYISPRARKFLELKSVKKAKLNIKVFGGESSTKGVDQVQFLIKSKSGESVLVNAFENEICKPLVNQTIDFAAKKFSHLRNLTLADWNSGNNSLNVDILIGVDFYWKFFNNTIVKGDGGGPVAMGSILGYVLSGPVHSQRVTYSNVVSTHVMRIQQETITEKTRLNESLERFWKLESIGILPEESSVFDRFSNEIERVDNRYQVRLPFKEHHKPLNENYGVAVKRLKGQWQRLKHDKSLLHEYNKVFDEQEKIGVIEKVSEDNNITPRHYLPHRPIVRNDKTTTKVRAVFDASAKSNGVSLNDCLLTGPSLVPSLFGVLLRFRSHNFAFSSDIEKAFLQIAVHPDDREFLRFLWFSDPQNIDFENFEKNELCTYRMCRVLFGATSSPFLLRGTLMKHLEQYQNDDPKFVQQMLDSLHVDDLISGGSSESEVISTFNKVKSQLADGSFKLHKFNSNSKLAEQVCNVHNDDSKEDIKVLGVHWNKKSDVLSFCPSDLSKKSFLPVTKRSVMHVIASLYDPLGIINPITVPLKCFFQKLCVGKVKWDEELTGEHLAEWNSIINQFESAPILQFDRLYGFRDERDPFLSIQLHGFSDASTDAYGCCVYLRFVYTSGKVKVTLISAKSRVKPMSNTTIPRMELLGALLMARLVTSVKSELLSVYEINETFCWTDSSIVYCWISNTDKTLKTFAQNRVNEIRNLSCVWKLVPSEKNPADIVSRGVSPRELFKNDMWFTGPMFLNLPETQWPHLKPGDCFTPEAIKEEKVTSMTTLIAPSVCSNTQRLSKVINVSKYNSLKKLIRVTAWVRRFVGNIKKKKQSKNKNNKFSIIRVSPEELTLSAGELEDARSAWISDVQQDVRKDDNYSKLEKTLGIFEDENHILRCRGRIGDSNLPYNTKFPILLSTNTDFLRLLILDSHERVLHNGVRQTLTELRQRYWIPRGRSITRNIIKRCWLCRRLEGKPFKYPPPPHLPEERVNGKRAFAAIGIDYAGPVFVTNVFGDRDETFKCWIAIATCTNSRAIYLDVVTSLSAIACNQFLRRFISRYGAPELIISDNGKAFISDEVQTFAANKNIRWRFNVEAAPWQGGFFERMIKSTKRCLKKLLLKKTVRFLELETLLREIESVINNRPLTYAYDDVSHIPLTPNHLIYGRMLQHRADDGELTNLRDIAHQDVVDQTNITKSLLQSFWSIWKHEYLIELREYHKKYGQHSNIVSVGDIVLISEEMKPRVAWRVGRVIELICGRDGIARGAKLVTISEHGNQSTLRRPVNKLVPLEVTRTIHEAEEQIRDEANTIQLTFVDDGNIPERVDIMSTGGV